MQTNSEDHLAVSCLLVGGPSPLSEAWFAQPEVQSMALLPARCFRLILLVCVCRVSCCFVSPLPVFGDHIRLMPAITAGGQPTKAQRMVARLAPLPNWQQLGQSECHWLDRVSVPDATIQPRVTASPISGKAGWLIGGQLLVVRGSQQMPTATCWRALASDFAAEVTQRAQFWKCLCTMNNTTGIGWNALPTWKMCWCGGTASSQPLDLDYWEYYEDCDYWNVEFAGPRKARQTVAVSVVGNRVLSRRLPMVSELVEDTVHRHDREPLLSQALGWLERRALRLGRGVQTAGPVAWQWLAEWACIELDRANPLR